MAGTEAQEPAAPETGKPESGGRRTEEHGVDAPGAASPGSAEELSDAPEPDVSPHPADQSKSGSSDTLEAEREGDEQGFSDLNRAFGQQVHNHFHAPVDAAGAAFGFGVPRAPGLAPGLVRAEDVERALLHYVRPEPCFRDALAKLRADHLVVLTGREDIGRRAGAFALLRRLTGAATDIRSLSPADSLADLAAGGSIKEHRTFVILDYLGETNAVAVQSYDMGRLAEELRRKQSYLVITATEGSLRRLAFKDHCVPWQAPDPLKVFRRGADGDAGTDTGGGPVVPRLPADLLARVAEQRRPADVAAAAVAFCDGGAEAAMRVLSGSEAEAVTEWFRAEPPLEDLLPLVALAFLEGVPERTYEENLAGLERFVHDWEATGEPGPLGRDPAPAAGTGPVTGAGRAVFRQSRALWRRRATALVRVERRAAPGQGDERSERRMVFTSPAVRDLVVRELHDLYGYELWYPLRLWLHDMSHQRDLGVRSEVARGAALLAHHALTEVDASLLQEWSAGPVNQRVTAALTLQYMAESDRLAPAALNVALGWAENRGQARALTMAMALAGTLGSLYRLKVLNLLWDLTGRAERLAVAARNSLVLLLQTAEQDPERVTLTLRYMRTLAVGARRGTHEHARATVTACHVLAAPRLADQPGTLIGALIQADPRIAPQAGRLWALLLLSRSRLDAVDALCRTLLGVRDQPSAAEAVRTLGEAMRAEMTAAQWQALSSRLMAALRRSDSDTPGARRLAQILLGTLSAQAGVLIPGPTRPHHVQGDRRK